MPNTRKRIGKFVKSTLYTYVEHHEKYRQQYKSIMTAQKEAINAYLPLKECTIREIKGLFTAAEITALTEYLRYIRMHDPYSLCDTEKLLYIIIDSEEHMNFENLFGVDYHELISKVQTLTAAQTYFLRAEILRYWSKNKNVRVNMDEFIDIFV